MSDVIETQSFCTKCGHVKYLKDFPAKKTTKLKIDSWCLVCHRQFSKNIYEKNKKKKISQVLEWRKNNPEKVKLYVRKYKNRDRKKITKEDIEMIGVGKPAARKKI